MINNNDKPEKVERAYLVGVQHHHQTTDEIEELLSELEELANTFGVTTVGKQIIKIAQSQARFLCGSGKVTEIIEECRKVNADVIIFDEDLTPSQQRNWESETENILVIDRREVILDIFAARATTKEATLQIELARAEYDLPRLARAWTHLSRQKGAVNMKGEGERQIELDRRMVRKRIQQLTAELAKVRKQRETQRKLRKKKPVPNAAIVGYTNAGKSSLLNLMTHSGVLADDKLFATLDPTTRKVELKNKQELLLTDTVGFIRKLPHDLVEAFKATLEEAALADFLIHVVDASNPNAKEHIETTNQVLAELEADKKRTLMVFNKIDQVKDQTILNQLKMLYKDSVLISVKSNLGIDKLREEMENIMVESLKYTELVIPLSRYDLIALVHRTSQIIEEEYEGENLIIKASIPATINGKIKSFIRT